MDGIAAIAHAHALNQVFDRGIDIALTDENVGSVDKDLRLDAEEVHSLVHVLHGGLGIAAGLLHLCQAVHCVIVHRLGAQDGLECLFGGIEVACLEVGLGNQVGTCQRFGIQLLCQAQVGQFARVVVTGITDSCPQDVFVKAQLFVGLGGEQHGLVDVGNRVVVFAIIIVLMCPCEQRIVVVGILGELLVIDFHHRVGDFVLEQGIAALCHGCHRPQGGGEQEEGLSDGIHCSIGC